MRTLGVAVGRNTLGLALIEDSTAIWSASIPIIGESPLEYITSISETIRDIFDKYSYIAILEFINY